MTITHYYELAKEELKHLGKVIESEESEGFILDRVNNFQADVFGFFFTNDITYDLEEKKK